MTIPTWHAAAAPRICLPGLSPSGWPFSLRAQDEGRSGTGAPPRGRVLVVEDEYFVALAAEDALASAGFEVVGVAATAEEAVEIAGTERPDLVLMDIRLAGARDGIDAASEIRGRLGIPSLFATAHSDAATRARGEGAAAPLGWLTKPYAPTELTAAVAAALAKLRGQDGEGT
ncbi:Response regulator receiver domain-containing protein [Belnapia rosea]|uniref:Response regulator receiver domain-containing protein n=1 Tax=Belnapia rosea TaxID=938405 RepID=A0A1G6LY52_9PROT|nr:Response regulator receiver domain-containing protein [Belnapia rosea]